MEELVARVGRIWGECIRKGRGKGMKKDREKEGNKGGDVRSGVER